MCVMVYLFDEEGFFFFDEENEGMLYKFNFYMK